MKYQEGYEISFQGINDKDLPLKLQMMNFYWNQGYVVRSGIWLYPFKQGEPNFGRPITDLDVFALRIEIPFKLTKAVVSAKSGHESDPLQLFALAGIRHFINADVACYIRARGASELHKYLAGSLGVSFFNQKDLERISLRLGVSIEEPFTTEIFQRCENAFHALKTSDIESYRYFTWKYWIDPPFYRYIRCLTYMERLKKAKNTSILGILLLGATLFVISIAQLFHGILHVDPGILMNEFTTSAFGGEIALELRKNIGSALKKLLKEVNRKDVAAHIESEGLSLPYHQAFNEWIPRVLSSIPSFVELPKLLDCLGFHLIDPNFTSIRPWSPRTRKHARDLFRFLEKTNTISPNHREKLGDLVDELFDDQ